MFHKSYSLSDNLIANSLKENIVFIGGNTLFKGIEQRLEREIEKIFGKKFDFKILMNVERKYFTWIGSSILASLTPFREIWITKEDW